MFSGFVNLVIYNHTDLQRHGKWPREIEMTVRDADAVIIDEAHNFRNPGVAGVAVKAPSRYRLLQDYLRGSGRPKQVFYLTATPVNNSVHDFRHMIELTTGGNERHFASTPTSSMWTRSWTTPSMTSTNWRISCARLAG